MYLKKDNHSRMVGDGNCLYFKLDLTPENTLVTNIQSITSKLKEKGQLAKKTNMLLDMAANEASYLLAMMAMTGVSKEGLKALIAGIKTNRESSALKEVLPFWKSGLNDKIFDPIDTKYTSERFHIANLLVTGDSLYDGDANLAVLRFCSYDQMSAYHDTPKTVLHSLANQFLTGSNAAFRGFQIQTNLTNVLRDLGVICQANISANPNGRSFDIGIYDSSNKLIIVIEVSYNNSTGSGITDKIRAFCEPTPGIVKMFVGGGPGYISRKRDLKNLCENADFCFGRTENQLVEFFDCSLNQLLKMNTSKASIKKLLSKHELLKGS